MRHLTKFEKFGLAAAVVVAGTFFYMKNIYDPQEKALKKTVKTLNQVVGKVNDIKEIPPLAQIKYRIEKKQEEYEKIQEKTANLTIKTGAPNEITELLDRITTKLDRSGLILKSFEPKAVVPGDFFPWNVYRFDIEGSYDRLLVFFDELRAMDDAVRVGELKIAKNGGKSLIFSFDLMI